MFIAKNANINKNYVDSSVKFLDLNQRTDAQKISQISDAGQVIIKEEVEEQEKEVEGGSRSRKGDRIWKQPLGQDKMDSYQI